MVSPVGRQNLEPKKDATMNYIGCDAHISTCTFHVLNEEGKSMDVRTMETNGAKLISYLREVKGEKKLVFEETNLARWLYALLRPEVNELVVCDPVKNRLLSQGPKTDRVDALKLAQLLRGGFLRSVFHQGDSREELRDLVAGYGDLIQDFVRLKNRYKALFRSQGIRKRGGAFYEEEGFLKDLKKGPKRFVAGHVYEILQIFEAKRVEYVKEMARQVRKYPEIKVLKSIPGIGTIQACKIVAIVVTPHRFKDKYKFFSYCGLVKHTRESDGVCYGQRQARGNSTLKCVFRMAGHTVLRGQSALRKHYDRLMSQGCDSHAAYNAVCRRIASLSLALWKRGENYRDDYVNDSSKQIRP